MKDSGANKSVVRDDRSMRSPHLFLLVACIVLLLLMLTGCDAATYAPPAQGTTVPETIATTTTLAPATTTPGSETTTTTFAPIPTTSSTTPSTSTTSTTQAVSAPGSLLYQITNWSGTSGWALTGQWKTVGGMLVSDGSEDSIAVAPYDPGIRSDYAVEAEIQFLATSDFKSCCLEARLVNGEGYYGGYRDWNNMMIGFGGESISMADFSVDSEWHTYRFEVSGNSMRLLFDGAEVVRAMDNRVLLAGTVGIWCDQTQVNIRAFRVIAL